MNEELIMQALRMLQERAKYWEGAMSGQDYASAATILEAAIYGDTATLNNMDYYGE